MENNANVEVKRLYEMQVSFLEAIRDHGLEETMITISKADPTELGAEALGAVWITLLGLYLPELIESNDFRKAFANILEESDDISDRINPAIDQTKEIISNL